MTGQFVVPAELKAHCRKRLVGIVRFAAAIQSARRAQWLTRAMVCLLRWRQELSNDLRLNQKLDRQNL